VSRGALRRRPPDAAPSAPFHEPARRLAADARQWIAGHVAGPLHGADRDRRLARAHRSGVGNARLSIAPRGPQALPARACAAERDAAARPRGRVARSLRSPRLSDDTRARQAGRALRDVARRWRAPRSLGRAAGAHHRARLVGFARGAGLRTCDYRCALAALFGARSARSQRHAVVGARHPFAAPHCVLQRRHGAHHRVFAIRERLGPFDLVMLEVGGRHPAWGDMHLGPENALRALALLGGGPFLPVHWGTFSLATHAWDEPAETLLSLGPRSGVQLVMPRLGEPVEPADAEKPEPWWRVVDATARKPEPEAPAATKLPKAVPWPID